MLRRQVAPNGNQSSRLFLARKNKNGIAAYKQIAAVLVPLSFFTGRAVEPQQNSLARDQLRNCQTLHH